MYKDIEIKHDETNEIKISLKNTIGLISKIKGNMECSIADDKKVLKLLNSVNAFIACFPEKFNEPQTIQGILNVLNKNLENISNNEDVLEKYYNENMENIFDISYDSFLTVNKISTGTIDTNNKNEVYCSAINKIEIFLNCLEE